jgi:hypothetical protein
VNFSISIVPLLGRAAIDRPHRRCAVLREPHRG